MICARNVPMTDDVEAQIEKNRALIERSQELRRARRRSLVSGLRDALTRVRRGVGL